MTHTEDGSLNAVSTGRREIDRYIPEINGIEHVG